MRLNDRDSQYILPTYRRLPVTVRSAAGAYLYDEHDDAYLDLMCGLGVHILGHGFPSIQQAILSQAGTFSHLSNYFAQEPQIRLAEILCTATGFDKVFYTNSGTESIEACVKIARKWGTMHNKRKIIAFHGGFHGRTMGSLSIMHTEKYRSGYGPFLSDCHTVPYNEPKALRSAVDRETAAVFLECIQGEGGIIPAEQNFIDELQALRSEFGFLIIADEIQAGIGRTGKLFSFEHVRMKPDIVAAAKALGGGLPLGAMLCIDSLAEVFGFGGHGTTFGGNAIACAAGISVMSTILQNSFMQTATMIFDSFVSKLNKIQIQYPELIKDIRGKGCLIGIELFHPAEPVMMELFREKIVVNITQGNVLRLFPPLILEEHAINHFTSALEYILHKHA